MQSAVPRVCSRRASEGKHNVPATVVVNFRTVVHKSSDGVASAFPDVCKTPSPAGPVPIPYPNIAQSKDTAQGSSTVTVDGNPIMLKGSNFSTSTGDEAGSAGGVASSCTKGKAEFVMYSFDVKVEGKNVPRLGDLMLQNKGGAPNTPPFPEVQPPNVAAPWQGDDEAKDDDITELNVISEEEYGKDA
jgi:uncharacterized Zn-binding protein involved in type VI secretion